LGNDVIDFIPFCDNIEKPFKELRVSLLKPFLNERARLSVCRLDAERRDDYDYVKQYLLDQFRFGTANETDTRVSAIGMMAGRTAVKPGG
jgi:hypothetical protein